MERLSIKAAFTLSRNLGIITLILTAFSSWLMAVGLYFYYIYSIYQLRAKNKEPNWWV